MMHRKRAYYIVNDYRHVVAGMCRKLGCESAWSARTWRFKMCTPVHRGCHFVHLRALVVELCGANAGASVGGCKRTLRPAQSPQQQCSCPGSCRLWQSACAALYRSLRSSNPMRPMRLCTGGRGVTICCLMLTTGALHNHHGVHNCVNSSTESNIM